MSNLMQAKSYDELRFTDDFMFGKVMENKELCREVLECLLQRPVGELEDPLPQREYRYTTDGKPIRLDIYTRDKDAVYDAEMQNLGKKTVESLELPRRTRYYQASLDMDHMKKTWNYKALPDSEILFICTFDPFGRGLSQYTFRGLCEEDAGIRINDGATRVFYNCSYKGDDVPEDIRELYCYIETGTCSNDLTERIDEAVVAARMNEEWRSAYMKEITVLMDAREEGRQEEQKKTEAERKRAETEWKRAEVERKRADDAEAIIARYREKYGELPVS